MGEFRRNLLTVLLFLRRSRDDVFPCIDSLGSALDDIASYLVSSESTLWHLTIVTDRFDSSMDSALNLANSIANNTNAITVIRLASNATWTEGETSQLDAISRAGGVVFSLTSQNIPTVGYFLRLVTTFEGDRILQESLSRGSSNISFLIVDSHKFLKIVAIGDCDVTSVLRDNRQLTVPMKSSQGMALVWIIPYLISPALYTIMVTTRTRAMLTVSGLPSTSFKFRFCEDIGDLCNFQELYIAPVTGKCLVWNYTVTNKLTKVTLCFIGNCTVLVVGGKKVNDNSTKLLLEICVQLQ